MSLAPSPITAPFSIRPRHVLLCGDGVVVAREHHQRLAVAPRPHPDERVVRLVLGLERRRDERPDVRGDLRLVPALGGNVHQLERALGQPGREVGHRPQAWHNPGSDDAAKPSSGVEPERGLVLAVLPRSADSEEELGELRELARTAGVEPIAELVQQRANPDPRTYVGKGKLEELKQAYENANAEVLIVDDELEPAQQSALENALTARVVDRTQLILDIFAQHATSAEGKLQVELAQLEYNLPRMRGMWQHLERLGGGTGALGAGVGTRGPGESQLETDRRIARRKISLLRRRLKEVGKHRATRRKEREGSGTPTVALAGYTNVGKSTLLNALTGADVSVENRLFETLDPTTRGFEHEGKRYLVTDTVGFIRRLPTQLVEGFASTLEETLVADLLLHVVDASEDDERLEEMIGAVDSVLHEIGADDVPVEVVLNKIDQVDPLGRRRLSNRFPGALQISATTGEGVEELRARIADTLRRPLRGRAAAAAVRGRREACRAVRARRSDRRARGLGGRGARTRPAAAPRGAPLRALSRRRRAARARRRSACDGAAGRAAARRRDPPGTGLRR